MTEKTNIAGTQTCGAERHPERKVAADQARILVNQVIAHAMENPNYRARLKSDPKTVLCAAGLATGPIEDISREMVIDGTSLSFECSFTCWFTCIVSWFTSDEPLAVSAS